MKNIQIIDGAWNATFSIFQATDEEFAELFPGIDQDMDVVEDVFDRLGEDRAKTLLTPLWSRPILKRDANGIHGTLFYDRDQRGWVLPPSKREVDLEPDSINNAQRALFDRRRSEWSAPEPTGSADPLIWLTQWYFSQCDADWEHAYGITVETLDNPGWSLTVDLTDTSLAEQPFTPVFHNMSEAEAGQGLDGDLRWWHAKVEQQKFKAYGGPHNLPDLIGVFRAWASEVR
jgi:hypothetical protein